jgi:hypothetical protein
VNRLIETVLITERNELLMRKKPLSFGSAGRIFAVSTTSRCKTRAMQLTCTGSINHSRDKKQIAIAGIWVLFFALRASLKSYPQQFESDSAALASIAAVALFSSRMKPDIASAGKGRQAEGRAHRTLALLTTSRDWTGKMPLWVRITSHHVRPGVMCGF